LHYYVSLDWQTLLHQYLSNFDYLLAKTSYLIISYNDNFNGLLIFIPFILFAYLVLLRWFGFPFKCFLEIPRHRYLYALRQTLCGSTHRGSPEIGLQSLDNIISLPEIGFRSLNIIITSDRLQELEYYYYQR